MHTKTKTKTQALHFDIHGRVRIRVDGAAAVGIRLVAVLRRVTRDAR